MSSTGSQLFSSRGKAVSELDQYQDDNLPECVDKLDSKLPPDAEMNARYEELKTEVLVLRRQLPQLKDDNGKDVTKEIISLREQLRKEHLDREKLEARIAELDRRPRISEWNDGESSIVSQFTLDRESARRVAESVRGTQASNDSDNFKSIHEDARQSLMNEVADLKTRYAALEAEYSDERERLYDNNAVLKAEIADLKALLEANTAKLTEAQDKLARNNEAHKIEMIEFKKSATSVNVNVVSDSKIQELNDQIAKLTAEIEGLNEDISKRDKLIRGFSKICGRSLNNATVNDDVVETDPRKVLVRTLYATLDCLDEFWKHRENLAAEVKALVESGEESGRYSVINDKLNKEREAIERQLGDMSVNETSSASFNPKFEVNAECSIDLCPNKSSIFNTTADITDLQYMQKCYADLKNTCQTLFDRLQSSADFLVRLTEALQNQNDPTSLALLKKIHALKLNATISDASIALNNANEAEKSMNATIERSIRASMSSSGIQTLQSVNAAEVASFKGRITELENQLSEAESQLVSVKTELSIKTSMAETLEQKLENYKSDVSSLDQLLAEQRRASDKAEFERDELRAQIAILEEQQDAAGGKTHEELVAAYKQIEELTAALEKSKSEAAEEAAQIQTVLTKTQKERDQAASNYRKEQDNFKKLIEELSATRKKYDEIVAERDQKSQAVEIAEKKLRSTVDLRAREHEKDLAKLRGALEKMTQSCNSYDAYLKAVVQKAMCNDDDDSIIDPPECIDSSIHDALLNVVSAPKRLEAVQAVVDELTHANDTSIAADPAAGDIQVTEVIERVSKAKDQANTLVQHLKKLITEPALFASFAARLLEWARENRDTLYAVLAHLEAVKAKNEKLVSTIITEMQEINTVLRQAGELKPKKHVRKGAKKVNANP